MRTRWIAAAALAFGLSCFGQSSGAPAQAKGESAKVAEITVSQLKDWMKSGRAFKLIDVREDDEWLAGHAGSAVHIALGNLAQQLETAVPAKSATVVLYCHSGRRSATGAQTAAKLGYANVYSLAGGFTQYQAEGLPTQK